ncbi:MAG TPA: hemerythrin domain-containing protein [Candidatus Acidoferrales bacterium]|nr:hemerythrin domain-containing protein [Candidatus Acidoferrales bacterium]
MKEPDSLGPVARFLIADHRRLDELLQRATANPADIDRTAYAAFRAGLLKHIAMEEKVLLPAAQRARGGTRLDVAAKLRLDHGALAALLVPTPTPAIVAALRAVLAAHNPLEEDAGGVYEVCETLAGADADALMATLRATPEVPVHAHVDGPRIVAATQRALARAGYDLDITDESHAGGEEGAHR